MKMDIGRWQNLGFASLAVATLTLSGTPAHAVHDNGAFELDKNAVDDSGAGLPDDWETLYNNGGNDGGSATAFSGIVADVVEDQIFTGGGSKTIHDVGSWKHKSASPGSPPDKDNITDAYAANYVVGGDQLIYFGADLLAANGDAELAFWFFQDAITQLPNGTFDGAHQNGDVYVAAKFSNGGAVATIAVYEWDDTCGGAASNNPQPGQCAATNIRVVESPSQSTCNGSLVGDNACAITNLMETVAPWPYTPKFGASGIFPATTFFEGGINISSVFGGSRCFSSFMATTGASTSFTATSKDYALGAFDVCSIGATKTCVNDDLTDDTTAAITYDIRGCAINGGAGDVYITSLANSIGGDTQYTPSDLAWFTAGTVDDGAGGQRAFDPTTDCSDAAKLLEAIDNGSAVADLTTHTVVPGAAVLYQFSESTGMNGASDQVTIDAEGTDGSAVDDATASATCPLRPFSASLSVTKQCAADLEDAGSNLVVKINVLGMVCNTGEVQLTNLTLTDDADMSTGVAVSLTPASTTLEPAGDAGGNDCTTYTGYYYPDSIPSGDVCPFADQVTAKAVAPDNSTGDNCALESDVLYCTADSNSATCNLRAVDADNDCSTGPVSTLPATE